MIDREPLDHPHRGGAIAARAVNERRFAALRGNGIEKLRGDRRVGTLAVERDVVEGIPAALAAAASPSMLASGSEASRRLMIEANPSFLISGTASIFVAPAQATVVSRRAKLVTPGTVSFVTCCAETMTPADAADTNAARKNNCLRIV